MLHCTGSRVKSFSVFKKPSVHFCLKTTLQCTLFLSFRVLRLNGNVLWLGYKFYNWTRMQGSLPNHSICPAVLLNYLSFCFLMTTFSVQLLFLWGSAWLPRLSNICPGSNRLLLAAGCPLATHIVTWVCKTKEAELESIKMFTQSPLVNWQTRVRARLIRGLLSWFPVSFFLLGQTCNSLLHPSGTGPSAKQVSLWFRENFRLNPTEYTHPVTSLHGIWMFTAFLREGKKRMLNSGPHKS